MYINTIKIFLSIISKLVEKNDKHYSQSFWIKFHIDATDVKVKAEVKFDINASREDFLKHSEEWRIHIEETVNINYFNAKKEYAQHILHQFIC